MRSLFLECNMGIAGDMFASALYELLSDSQKNQFLKVINNLGLDGVQIDPVPSSKNGIFGTHMVVTIKGETEESIDVPEDKNNLNDHHFEHHSHHHNHNHLHHHGHDHHSEHNHHHSHFSMYDVKDVVNKLSLEDAVKKDIVSVYEIIAEAESNSHQVPIDQIHFHEVGQLDAIIDVAMSCILVNMLDIQSIISSPVNTGRGNVRCAHGILPVPAPATAYILKDIPNYSNQVAGELTTPTGAAILKYFVNSFSESRPVGRYQVGYGMGTKDFEQANCVRAFLSEEIKKDVDVIELTSNIDDMTPEALGYATKVLLSKGALDVYVTNIQMKKNRPGFLLTVTCREKDRDHMLKNIFKHTTTLGIKEYRPLRYALKRELMKEETLFGEVQKKISKGYGVERTKYEYDDLIRIAQDNDQSLEEVLKKL